MHRLHNLASVRSYFISALEACLALLCYVGCVLLFHPVDGMTFLELETGGAQVVFTTVTFLIATYLFGFYYKPHGQSRLVLALELCQLAGALLLIHAVASFLNADLVLPQRYLLPGTILLPIVLMPWWLYIRPLVWNAFGMERTLFLGWSPATEDLARAFLTQPALGADVVGYVGDTEAAEGVRRLGGFADFDSAVTNTTPARVIVAGTVRNSGLLTQLLELKAAGVSVQTDSQVYEAVFGRVDCRGLDPQIVVFLDDLAARPAHVALQSIYTNVLALAAAVISLPAMGLIALLLRITGSGPILTRRRCVGLHGVPFTMFRFRCSPLRNDLPGRLFASWRLDGLPQIVNIIRGEMTLIGPRAESVEFDRELNELIPFYRQKQFVKPGIFGWGQLHCDAVADEYSLTRLELDLYYIKHTSVVLDAYVVLRALKWLIADPVAGGGEMQVGEKRASAG